MNWQFAVRLRRATRCVGVVNCSRPSRHTLFLIRRERAERAGQVLGESPTVLARMGISTPEWEAAVPVTSRRFARELERSAQKVAEVQPVRYG